MLQALKHPGIVQMKSAWSENGYFYILQEFALNGDLSDFIR
jgi:serine/threonine protein kinase